MSQGEPLAPSLDLVRRTLAADVSYTVSRMQVLERIRGNPIGIAYRWIDSTAVALMSGVLPAFSRVVGLRPEHALYVGPLVNWYRSQGVKPTFEMVPGMFDAGLGRELTRRGLCPSGFHTALIGAPGAATPDDGQIEVEPVLDADAMERYLDAYVAGWAIPPKDHVQFKANVRPWREQPGWSLYLAQMKGRPAAAGTLYIHERVGYLADAATDPSCRGQGLQSALLRRRIKDAGAAGVDFVCSGAAPFSTSHRNMERAGMRIQFIRSLWTPA